MVRQPLPPSHLPPLSHSLLSFPAMLPRLHLLLPQQFSQAHVRRIHLVGLGYLRAFSPCVTSQGEVVVTSQGEVVVTSQGEVVTSQGQVLNLIVIRCV